MRLTRVFLGSSEELREDRVALGDFMGRLSDAYVSRGTRFSLVKRGVAPTLEQLNGKWAVPGNGYGESIASMIDSAVLLAQGN